MLKILTLLLSILSKNIIGNENNYRLVEKEYVESNIVQSIDDEYFLVYDDKYSLFYNDYNFDLSNYDNVCVYKRNDKIYIIASNSGSLENIILSKTLEKEQQITLVRDGITNWQSEMYNNKIYIYGKSNEYNDLTYEEEKLDYDDAFLLIIDEFNHIDYNFFGGKTNEEFQKILINDNYIIAAGYKSPLGEGDFGNGGRYEKTVFITKIENKSIKNYIILNEYDNIVDLFYYDNTYYLVLQSGIYFLDENLSLIEQITYNDRVDACQISEKGLMVTFSNNCLDIYDLNNRKHEEILYPYQKVNRIQNSFVVTKENNKVLCDLIDLTDFYSRYEYVSDKTDLYSLFGKCSYQDVTFFPSIDYQVYGEYQCHLFYQTLGGIDFEYETIYNIEREANVCDGGIYPVGYRLLFSGRGYLDGNLILNNYQIVNPGSHVLELVGANDQVYLITFEVSNYQVFFEDILNRNSELEVRCGEKFSIALNLNGEKEIEIESLLINDSEYYDFLYDSSNHLLTISFSPKQEVGRYIYNIEKLYYKLNGKTYCDFLNYRFVVNVLKNNLNTQIISFEDLSLYIDCLDYHKSARYFKVVAFNDFEEKEYSFPISNEDIYLTDLKVDNSYNVKVYLVSDINSSNLLLNPIVDMHIIPQEKDVYLGKILILKYQEFLERFAISFNKTFSRSSLKEISINDKLIFKNNRQNFGKYLFMCCGAFVMGVGIIVISKLLIKKKKNGK